MHVAAGSITNVQSSAPSNGTLNYSAGGPGSSIPGGSQSWQLQYTNNTGGTITMEVSMGLRGKGTGAGGSANVSHVISASLSDGVGGESINPPCDGGTAFTAVSWSKSRSLANGDTVTFIVGISAAVGNSSGTWSAGSVSWESVSLRLTAVLR